MAKAKGRQSKKHSNKYAVQYYQTDTNKKRRIAREEKKHPKYKCTNYRSVLKKADKRK